MTTVGAVDSGSQAAHSPATSRLYTRSMALLVCIRTSEFYGSPAQSPSPLKSPPVAGAAFRLRVEARGRIGIGVGSGASSTEPPLSGRCRLLGRGKGAKTVPVPRQGRRCRYGNKAKRRVGALRSSTRLAMGCTVLVNWTFVSVQNTGGNPRPDGSDGLRKATGSCWWPRQVA